MTQISIHKTPENLLPYEGEAYYFPDFFDPEKSQYFFQNLKENIHWKQEPIKIFGKEVLQPRLTALYGNPEIPYSYSGIRMQAQPFNEALNNIKNRIEQVAKVDFTHVLLNYYRHGQDSMGWHRDNEKELGPNPVIGSISFGAKRKFHFRHYRDKRTKVTLDLQHGSFLLMAGATQHHWEHQVPKTRQKLGERINLTFRVIR
ncbi:alpha-ketoglutarate-dependent dioxygenase AlkB family protein [Pararhodonellum marinum]|uniref:alpha-ketoglutarate-dependent dioxygenase AlkB family protein n=1 Tax=Pararhodonellum marinum TaxID=2755358 RepID=UPI00188F53C0|nr:alpha-ketoglutarate-dependent dioxygenase AlkB [Pararhodonellum marinum]